MTILPDWLIDDLQKQKEAEQDNRPVLYVPEPMPPEKEEEIPESPRGVIEIQIW